MKPFSALSALAFNCGSDGRSGSKCVNRRQRPAAQQTPSHVSRKARCTCDHRHIHDVANVQRISDAISHIQAAVLRAVVLVRLMRINSSQVRDVG